ncbi:MAG: MATE family efflux transporter [Pseudomonas fluorescens]|nr:MATE family efflux transporter [Pseudomonas fluorescens]
MNVIKANPSVLQGSRKTLELAIPLILSQVAIVIMTVVDTVAFSWLGVHVLAAGALATALFSLVHIVCSGVLIAISNQVAFENGAGNRGNIAAAVESGVILSVLIGMAAILLIAVSGPLLLLAGQDVGTVSDAMAYLPAAALGIIPSLLFTTFRGLTVGLGRPGPITFITVCAVLFKMVLNCALVVMVQASWVSASPSVLLRMLGAISSIVFGLMAFFLWYYCSKNFAQYLRWPQWVTVRSATFRDTLAQGIPIGISYGVEAGLFTCVALLIGHFGPTALAAHHIANQCVFLTFMMAVGLSHASSIRVGEAAGSGDLAEAKRLGRQGMLIGLVPMTFTAGLYFFFGDVLVGLLVGVDTSASREVASLAIKLLAVAACFQWFDSTQVIAAGALRGLKDARFTMIASILGYWGVGMTTALWLSRSANIGPSGVWWGLVVGLGTTACMLVLRFEHVTNAPEMIRAGL